MSIAYRAVDPATGEVVAEHDTATDAEVEAALAAAHAAASSWGALAIEERAAVASEVARLFAERKDALAELAQREMGKPLSEGVEEAEFCEAIFRYFATEGPRLAADQPIPTGDAGGTAVIQRRPLGALLGIMPWNFPYYQVARFVAPNLVLGNTMLVKHAESVPGCALAIARLLADAGVPEGVYANLFADHDQIETIIADPRVQGVSLTGSERAGAAVASLAGRHLKKCVLELGGSDPMIILDTDDLDAVVTAAWDFRTYNTGQACNANKRIIVVGDLADDVVAGLVAKAEAVTDPAPLSSRRAAETLHEQVQDAVAHGATLHAGGVLGPAPTAHYSPAVLSGIPPEARAFGEELFGPVAAVYRVESAEEALALANSSAYGLGGSVFSADPARARAVAERLECGMANVNSTAGEGAELPFGGVKRSGFGRELGPLGMEEFVNKRLMYVAD
ncbi:NAD-dependent succinate-semialdehyde dehydrogenase [Nocardioides sp. TRM66260-LWL]|uniref:NAD-dependent succinate-semialdehyde dehydrogenase n=1 Tax=Nocardioides sp. TRM66260-LWL TaxID=2874478 RepID=UPI001CC814A8|nr:NAD-dependent succinate-semialdehyde dehydrogenase [Nocardioides sp. TRM66260-LWL]MBZ5736135.1 NAD-dependent succinate-semialdehyde dehydrogenase [Nocardioides sp. TRM66260-LWL]